MSKKQDILNKTNGICYLCGKKLTLKTMTIDHYIPKSRGGGNDLINLMPLCLSCNQKKSNKMIYKLNNSDELLNFMRLVVLGRIKSIQVLEVGL